MSCTSASTCTAVGGYGNNGSAKNALAETWNGTSWTVQSTAALFGGKDASLGSVSCVRAASCTAVGDELTLIKPHRHDRTLAEHWKGTTWAVQATVRPAGAVNSSLASVSCHTQTFCTSVGSYGTSSVPNIVLAEQS